MNKFLTILVLAPSIAMYSIETTKVPRAAIVAALDLGRISLRCSNDGFKVKGPTGVQLVEPGDMDVTLRKINPTNLAAFAKAGKIIVSKTNDGKYILRSHINGLGGGVWGAWAGMWVGKFVVHGVTQGVLLGATAVISAVATPAAGAWFYAAAVPTVATSAEAFSNVVAIGTGILGAVATGPI